MNLLAQVRQIIGGGWEWRVLKGGKPQVGGYYDTRDLAVEAALDLLARIRDGWEDVGHT